MILVVRYSSVKYHSIFVYLLTSSAKTMKDSIWWAVLVGRYPRGYKINFCIFDPWRLQGISAEKNIDFRKIDNSNSFERNENLFSLRFSLVE